MNNTDTYNSFEEEIGHLGSAESENSSLLSEADMAVETLRSKESAPEEAADTERHVTKILTPEQRRRQMFAERTGLDEKVRVTKIGEKIQDVAEIREGWIPVDRGLLGERDVFYPESWKFMIRPATVEAIKNWSTVDEDDPSSIHQVFNEILKTCLSIQDEATGVKIPWSKINSWDRFFFILLIRDYTFSKGEQRLEYTEECPGCDNDVTFRLETSALFYELPDPEVMPYWNREDRCWIIDTAEFGLDRGVLTLYVPTVEKDANIWKYITTQYQNKGRVSRDFEIFLKYLVWLLPSAPKDQTLLKQKVRQAEMEFKGWSTDEFLFIDDVIRNIEIVPSTKLKTTCPTCGEEVTSEVRFPNGIKSIFAVHSRFTKFGKK